MPNFAPRPTSSGSAFRSGSAGFAAGMGTASRIRGQASEEEDDLDRTKRLEKQEYDALQEVLNEILVEAFAVVREAGRRVLNMRHFDVQLIGGMVLHDRHDLRNEDRRRQNAGRHASRLPQCAQRPRRARGYRE